jgi:hypothetical protein
MRKFLVALEVSAWCVLGLAQQPPARKPPASVDSAIEEFKIQTRDLGLREDSSPAVKAAAKSGQQKIHGRFFENFRNDFLDAVPHEIAQRGESKSLLRRNQFGFNVAGPVAIPHLLASRNDTFFSLSYEGVRERVSRTSLQTIPTMEERTGDYSAVVNQAGLSLPIYDPKSTRPNPGFDASQPVSLTNLQYLRDPFPNNKIPTARLDPVAQQGLLLYPAPNTNVGPFNQNNYFVNSPETDTANGMIGKVDHSFHERHRVSTELAFSNGLLGAAKLFPNDANPGPSDRIFNSRRGSLEHVYTASSQTVNTLTFEVTATHSRSGDTTTDFPQYQLSPFLNMGRSYPDFNNKRNTFVLTDGISTRRGKHSLHLVLQQVHYQVNTFWPQYPAGSFHFSPGITSLPGIIDTGDAFASFLLGLPDLAQTSRVTAPSYFRQSHGSISLSDSYEIRKDLAITLSLTTTRDTPRTEKYNRQSTISASVINPANGLPGALLAASDAMPSFRPTLWRAGPSIGLAWNVKGQSKTVVRASFARSYSFVPVYTGQWGTQGFNGYAAFVSPNPQLDPALILANGFPPPTFPLPDLRPDAVNGTIADFVDQSHREPMYQSASATVERELPGAVMMTAGFSYSGGRNLLVSNGAANPNAISPNALVYRDQLNDETFNSSLRPFPQYKGFDVYSSYPLGKYQRDAGFLRLEKRASKGLTLSAYYEVSKQLDDYSGPYGTQDFFNRRNEWALTPYNQPQRLTVSYSYELPLGVNKTFLPFSDWRRYLVEGWSLSGTAALASGTPIALHPLFNNTGGVISALHVNAVPGVDPNVSDQNPSNWFNAAAFDQPPDFTLGDVARTHPTLRNPGSQNYDLSVSKRVAVDPEHAVEFSAAGFNFLNHANWNDPDSGIGPASAPNVNAGKIIGSRGGRVIQLGLRFSF